MNTLTYTSPSSYQAASQSLPINSAQDDELLVFKEAMTYLRVSRSTLYRLIDRGALTGHKVGYTWRFYREDLRACVAREVPLTQTCA